MHRRVLVKEASMTNHLTIVPTFPEPQLHVVSWPDEVLDQLGHDPLSDYVEIFWVSVLGPTATLLVRRLAKQLAANPGGYTINCADWAKELGIGDKGGKNSPFWRSVERACRFGAAQRNGAILAVRPKLPPLTIRQLNRLPIHMRTIHTEWDGPAEATA